MMKLLSGIQFNKKYTRIWTIIKYEITANDIKRIQNQKMNSVGEIYIMKC